MTISCGLRLKPFEDEAWASNLFRPYSNLRRRLWKAKLKGWDEQVSIHGEGLDSRLCFYGIDMLRDAWYVKSAIKEFSWLYKSRIGRHKRVDAAEKACALTVE